MNVTVYPHSLSGRVSAPPSKSHVHRLLIAASLCESGKETRVHCPGENQDIEATLRCLDALHAHTRKEGDWLSVCRRLPLFSAPCQRPLDCGESGSTLRFLLPLCCAMPPKPDWAITLNGSGRLPSRPNEPLLKALRDHGAFLQGDFLPFLVRGGLRPGSFALPGNVSSQYFTGLLFILPLLPKDSTLQYTSFLESGPYVDLTLSVLEKFGIRIFPMENGWRVPGGQRYRSPGEIQAEGDWSAAAFWLGANALGGKIDVGSLNPFSFQGDKAITDQLRSIGGEINVSQTPDSMPILAAVAAAMPGKTTRITGGARLRLKESDRIAAMKETILSLGGSAEEEADGLIIHGTQLQGGTVDGMNDHRVVMSAAVAAAACQHEVTILGAEAVNKSYPRFWRDFEALGGSIHVG